MARKGKGINLMTTNNPPIPIEPSTELAEFLLKNCDAAISFGFQNLQVPTSRDLLEKTVENIKNFKNVKRLIEKELN
jgi:hypothetical protein